MQVSPLSSGCEAPLLDFFVWLSHILDAVSEVGAIDNVDFFMVEVASVNGQRREGAAATAMEGLGMMTVEADARVLCAGMSVAIGVLVAFGSAQ